MRPDPFNPMVFSVTIDMVRSEAKAAWTRQAYDVCLICLL